MSESLSNQPSNNVDQPSGNEPTSSSGSFAEMLQLAKQDPPTLQPHMEFHQFLGELKQATPRCWCVWTIVALNIAVMVLMALADPKNLLAPSIETLVQWGADYGPRTLRHEWWRLLTCTFLHIGIVHLLFNMWALIQVGELVERLVGNTGFGLLYLISGVSGSLLSLAWNPIITSAGASGAVFGVYGALLGIVIRQRQTFPKGVVRNLRNSTLAMFVYNGLFGLSQPGIDQAAHLGGAFAGLLCGLMLSQKVTSETASHRSRLNFRLALVSAGLIGVSFVFLPDAPADFAAEVHRFIDIEKRSLAAYNSAIEAAHAQKLTDPEFAVVIADKVLPDWIVARQRMETLDNVHMRQRTIWVRLVEYMKTRESGWTLIQKGCRQQDSKLANQGFEQIKRAGDMAAHLND